MSTDSEDTNQDMHTARSEQTREVVAGAVEMVSLWCEE